jgi:hypothetical protein
MQIAFGVTARAWEATAEITRELTNDTCSPAALSLALEKLSTEIVVEQDGCGIDRCCRIALGLFDARDHGREEVSVSGGLVRSDLLQSLNVLQSLCRIDCLNGSYRAL